MAFLALLTRDAEVESAVRRGLGTDAVVVRTGLRDRLGILVRERPVSCVALDQGYLQREGDAVGCVRELQHAYPSVAIVLVARAGADYMTLLRLGRLGIGQLVLVPLEGLVLEIRRAVARSLGAGAEALVVRAVSPYVSAQMLGAVRLSMRGAQLGWDTPRLAASVGWSRPHLSVRLKEAGLPSAGHLLTWARMLHAGRWLTDPGRTAESVSRQLGYATGATFRRALRSYVDVTPTELIAEGGIHHVLGRFMDACGLGRGALWTRSVA